MTDEPIVTEPDNGPDMFSSTSVLDDGTEVTQFSHDPDSGAVDALVVATADGMSLVQVNPGQPGSEAFVYDGADLIASGEDRNGDDLVSADELVAVDPGQTDPALPEPSEDRIAPEDIGKAPESTVPAEGDSPVITGHDPVDTAPEGDAPESLFVDRDSAEVAEDVTHGFEQSTGYTCAPSAVTMVLADFFDIDVGSEIEAGLWAAENGLLSEANGGMFPDGIVAVLEHYGVPAHLETGSMDTLDGYLDEGRAVILAVDASEYWNDPDVPDDTGHAVRVVDIDVEHGTATLTDSGRPDGAGLEVPLADLEKAWADRGHSMVVTDAVEFDAPDHDTAMIATGDVQAVDEVVTAEPAGVAPDTGPSTGVTDTASTDGIPAEGDKLFDLGHVQPLDLPDQPAVQFPGVVLIPGILSLAGWAAVRAAARRKDA
ncbi:MAG: hypothetical protein WKF57_19115 [Nakamurella sp.]